MRRDCLKLRLSDPSPGSLSFHASDSEEESSDRGSRSSRSGMEEPHVLPITVTAAQVNKVAEFLSMDIYLFIMALNL
ncbi:hypothetical protein HW555_005991 [Spodoptera exigua]|uniref:Uncharacterized protein n=1 Tax=Spodoptera exigua TaxID=7107 RepID=A0A835GGY8_SPOEX|nr:hypothetical protein HW555_005991 [Spodoptera exigua]